MQSKAKPNVERDFPDYLRDESRQVGRADSICFATCEEDIRNEVLVASTEGAPLTVQGARTGITGGAVPHAGRILNLSRMTAIGTPTYDAGLREARLTVQPGAILSDIRQAVADADLDTPVFFPPDPTETSAAIGGMVACNASGAQSFHYGPTRRYVRALRVVLADGSTLSLCRGEAHAAGRSFELTTADGRRIAGRLPGYTMPDVKSAAGYFVRDDMDLLDLFIGAEGTLGVISEAELRLVPAPASRWGITAFFPDEAASLDFVERVRTQASPPVAVEFFSTEALELLRCQKAGNPAFKELPDIPDTWHTAVYVEYHAEDDDAAEQAVTEMCEWMVESGGDPDNSWMASDAHEMERLKAFRHAIPEAVNLLIDERRKSEPGLTKLGTDLAVPDAALRDVLSMYRKDLDAAGLQFVIFGHIGNNHVHVNIIPADMDQYASGKTLYLKWAARVVALAGTVSAEHGIGKLKTALLQEMYGAGGIREMSALKRIFDPTGILNPGNLFEPGNA